MYCPNCGHGNPDGNASCGNCATALPAPPPVTAPAPAPRPMLDLGGPKPPSHLVWAILATVLCCLPTGIAAIVFAAQVDGRYAAGDYTGALQSSANAKTWSWVSFGLGLVFVLFYLGLGVLGALAGGAY